MRKLLYSMFMGVMVVTMVVGMAPSVVSASSHREAPLISNDPAADNTDLYAFVSPDAPNTVTIIANYIPLEEPAGGPNFAAFDDSALYEINVDNTGDAKEDISYQFRFKTSRQNPNTFLYNTGQITSLTDPDWNVRQTYTVTRVKGNDGKVLGKNIPTPPVNIGPRSTPDYEALAASAVTTLSGGIKVFAGQRDDPFFVDLGSIFDLGGLRPFNGAHLVPLATAAGVDGVGGYNTHTIAIQIPISQLKGPNGQMIIGIYASASRQKISHSEWRWHSQEQRLMGSGLSSGQSPGQRSDHSIGQKGLLELPGSLQRPAVSVELYRSRTGWADQLFVSSDRG